jgi:hypothetical protein
MSALQPKADMLIADINVRYVPEADLAFESVAQVNKSAQFVTIEGISSTRN